MTQTSKLVSWLKAGADIVCINFMGYTGTYDRRPNRLLQLLSMFIKI